MGGAQKGSEHSLGLGTELCPLHQQPRVGSKQKQPGQTLDLTRPTGSAEAGRGLPATKLPVKTPLWGRRGGEQSPQFPWGILMLQVKLGCVLRGAGEQMCPSPPKQKSRSWSAEELTSGAWPALAMTHL